MEERNRLPAEVGTCLLCQTSHALLCRESFPGALGKEGVCPGDGEKEVDAINDADLCVEKGAPFSEASSSKASPETSTALAIHSTPPKKKKRGLYRMGTTPSPEKPRLVMFEGFSGHIANSR